VKLLINFAIDRGYRSDNPAARIKLFKGGTHRAWTPEERARFEARWALGTLQRTAYALSLYTGQRRADVAAMKPSAIAGGAIKLTQGKTGAVLEIPMHSELLAALKAWRGASPAAILANDKAAALNPVYFGALMAGAIDDAGLPDDCVLHGLRKSATTELIDAGCTPHQAAGVTGHKSLRMIEGYARDHDRHKAAGAAIVKWNRATARNRKRTNREDV
jgi:enterobacteria phage integrase